MKGQRIEQKYLQKLNEFFEEHHLCDPPVIQKNEQKFCEFLNAKTFKLVNSGTSALYLIMNHIKKEGQRNLIWGPALTHISWINCANWLGYNYDYVDVSEETLSLDPNKLLEKIKNEGAPDVVVMVDMAGYVGKDTLTVKQICEQYNIIMIEDSAHAFGQKYAGKYAGTFGDYGFFSFSTPKLLTVGEGGGLICANGDINHDIEEAIYQGGWYRNCKKSYTKGLNFIMSNWLTELLGYQLDDLDDIRKAHYDDFQRFLKRSPNLITFDSDNELYAPSVFVRKVDPISDELKEGQGGYIGEDTIWGRYKNMADATKYPVAQKLEDTLAYWLV